MEYLVEVQWGDFLAEALSRILLSEPEGVDQATSYVSLGRGRGFVVYRCAGLEALDGIVGAVSNLGAQVWVTPMASEGARTPA